MQIYQPQVNNMYPKQKILLKRDTHCIFGQKTNMFIFRMSNPDSKDHGANMGPTWGRQAPCGPHVGHMNLAIWEHLVGLMHSCVLTIKDLCIRSKYHEQEQVITRHRNYGM